MSMRAALEAVAGYHQAQYERGLRLGRLLHEANMCLGAPDLEPVNARLAAAGRADLAMTERAAMVPVEQVPDIVGKLGNNFTPGFRIFTGEEASGGTDINGKPSYRRIPITEAELLAHRSMPKPTSRQKIKDLHESGSYPALWNANTSHAAKPFFLRLLNLFPGPTIELVQALSVKQWEFEAVRLESVLFAVHQLSARLVDASDLNVRDSVTDEVNTAYLR